MAKVRLKLKAKRRLAQWKLRHQTDMTKLEEKEVEEFRRVFAEELGAGPADGVEEVWSTFKEALKEAQSCLPHAIEREEKNWVTEEVREVSKKKEA